MHVKTVPGASASGQLRVEAAGLRWLAQAPGGVRVARPLEVRGDVLVLPRVARVEPTRARAEEFGRRLVATHDAGAPGFGAGPPGTSGDGWVGTLRLSQPPAPVAGWGGFYAAHRLEPHLRAAVADGAVDRRGAGVVEAVCERLRAEDPALTGSPAVGPGSSGALPGPDGPGDAGRAGAGRAGAERAGEVPVAARLHGDLWSGNVLWDAGGAVLIDPAAHGGHRESDLALLALFGLPHLETVLGAYAERAGLDDGWRARVPLHQLHPLLVHAALFGGGYGDEAVRAARAALRLG